MLDPYGPRVSALPETVEFLPLWCPTPSAIHPRWEELDQPALEWVERTGLARTPDEIGRLHRMNWGKLAACIHPHGVFDRLLWETKLNLFLCFFDDDYCDAGETSRRPGDLVRVTNRLTYILETPATSAFDDDPLAVALRDLRRELDTFATPAQVTRWVHACAAYLHRQALHAAYRERGTFPPFDEFFAARLDSSGSKLLVVQGDIVEGFEVPIEEWRHPQVQAVVDACGTAVCLANDLFSYNEERQPRREWIHNLVELYAAHHGCGRQDAVRKTVAAYEQIVRVHLALREKVRQWGGTEVNRYVDLCGHWARANHDWAMTSSRYARLRTSGLPARYATDAPWATGKAERSPLSAIQWWWDLLDDE